MQITALDDNALEREGRFHACLDDLPGKSGQEMKEFMDYVPRRVIIPKLNEVINALEGKAEREELYSAQETDALLESKAEREEVYTRAEVDEMLSSMVICEKVANDIEIEDMVRGEHIADIRVESKNLIPVINGGEVSVINGITFERQYDGSILVNGTATANSTYIIYFELSKLLPDGVEAGSQYTVYCEADGAQNGCSFTVNYYNEQPKGANYLSWVSTIVGGTPKTAVLPQDAVGVRMYINISKGTTITDTVFMPMFERGGSATGFTPYRDYLGDVPVLACYEKGGDDFVEIYSDESGRVDGMNVVYPYTRIFADRSYVNVICQYRWDLGKAISQLLRQGG